MSPAAEPPPAPPPAPKPRSVARAPRVAAEVAWSADADRYLALLAEVHALDRERAELAVLAVLHLLLLSAALVEVAAWRVERMELGGR